MVAKVVLDDGGGGGLETLDVSEVRNLKFKPYVAPPKPTLPAKDIQTLRAASADGALVDLQLARGVPITAYVVETRINPINGNVLIRWRFPNETAPKEFTEVWEPHEFSIQPHR